MDVKRIYFEENSYFPIFEMEDGSIKLPCIKGFNNVWLTEEEVKKINEAEENRLKKIPWWQKILMYYGG